MLYQSQNSVPKVLPGSHHHHCTRRFIPKWPHSTTTASGDRDGNGAAAGGSHPISLPFSSSDSYHAPPCSRSLQQLLLLLHLPATPTPRLHRTVR
jgi:hypothetical protein